MPILDDNIWWKQLFERSLDPCWMIQEGQFVDCNDAAVSALGYSSRSELLNLRPAALSPERQPDGEESSVKAERMIALALEKGVLRFEWMHRRKAGTEFPVEVTLTKIQSEGKPLIYCAWRDITERMEAELKLQESEQHFRTLANSGSTLIWTSGTDKLCNYFNEAWLRFTGRTLEQEIGNGWAEGVHPDDFEHCLNTYVSSFDQRIPFSMFYRVRNKDGEYRWLRDDGNPRYDTKGRFLGYIGYCMDATQQKEYEETIKSMAFYDYLTGLPNRRMLVDRLEKAFATSQRHGREGALLFVDLDNFKSMNDSFGHEIGDLLLKEASQRLLACVRESDTVSRFGGDEFVVMLEYLDEVHATAVDQARGVGEKILSELRRPYVLDGKECTCTASIGLVLFNGKQKTADEALREADALMYRSKLSGRSMLSD